LAIEPSSGIVTAIATLTAETQDLEIGRLPKTRRSRRFIYIGAFSLVALVAVLGGWYWRTSLTSQNATNIPNAEPPRWQHLAAMPTARSGLAVAAYENNIFAMGGETQDGVTSVVEVYDVAGDRWTAGMAKPTPVTDVSAAVVGGQIYVPGGRLTTGAITNVLEAYDPQRNQWDEHALMPVALSAYALVAFEGHLYVFGGWDGAAYEAQVYEYDPSRDEWTKRTPMPTARGFSGATVADGKVYVIGGRVGNKVLAVNEQYVPENDDGGSKTPWTQRNPLPQPRYGMGVAGIADIVHIIGGADGGSQLTPLEYFPQRNQWQSFSYPVNINWYGLGLVAHGTYLHAVGGFLNGQRTAQQLNYQAIYIISLPVTTK
jgi:hypothetical protein